MSNYDDIEELPFRDAIELLDKTGRGSLITHYAMTMYRSGKIKTEDLKSLTRESINETEEYRVEAIALLIDEGLGKDEDVDGLLEVAHWINNNCCSFPYADAVIRHGSNDLIAECMTSDHDVIVEGDDEDVCLVVVSYLKAALDVSEERLEQIVDLVSHIDFGTETGMAEVTGDYITCYKIDRTIVRALLKYCTINEVEEYIKEYYTDPIESHGAITKLRSFNDDV